MKATKPKLGFRNTTVREKIRICERSIRSIAGMNWSVWNCGRCCGSKSRNCFVEGTETHIRVVIPKEAIPIFESQNIPWVVQR